MLYYFMSGITYAFAAAFMPGPLQGYLISQTLSKGWRQTLPAVFAPLMSDGPIIIVIVFLLNHVPPWFINVLQCLGGGFLLFLAFKAWEAWRNRDSGKVVQSFSGRQSIREAVTLNFLNPGPYLSWSLVMAPLLLKGWRETPFNGIALLVGFYSCMMVCLIGIIFLFSYTKSFGPRVTHGLILASAIFLALYGTHQLWTSVQYFWPSF